MLYLDNGYVDFSFIENLNCTWNIIIGGRGTGKTFGILKKLLTENRQFVFMRKTQSQIDFVASDTNSPFTSINKKCGWFNPYVGFRSESKGVYGIYDIHITDDKEEIGKRYGWGLALSTIKNIRGFDASDAEYLVYDEFIPEPHEREIKFEGSAFFNAYETINRNRELEGSPALKVYMLANSNNLANSLLIELGIVETISKLIKSKKSFIVDYKRSLAVIMLDDSPISERKQETALYKIAPKSFADMSIRNRFSGDYNEYIKSMNLREYYPIACIGELTLYKHKSINRYYFSPHKSGSPREYPYTEDGLRAFKNDFYFLQLANLRGLIYYENQLCLSLLTRNRII